MRNNLPREGPHYNESAIINLDNSNGEGIHWVAYVKKGKKVIYFDSIGDSQQPLELILYFDVKEVMYNYERFQNFNTFNCGHLCLKFLNNELKI